MDYFRIDLCRQSFYPIQGKVTKIISSYRVEMIFLNKNGLNHGKNILPKI